MARAAYAVPYTDLGQLVAEVKDELTLAFGAVLESGRYIMGPELSAFEHEFADYCEARFAVGISSGTSALHLVLRALGLDDGDEVITVPNSFVASAATIALAGLRPVFVDIGPDLNMDPSRIEAAITPRTKAIMPVHLTGRPARMAEVREIAQRRDLVILEDAAQSLGARLGNSRVGSGGNVACFSLHPLKNLHAFGDGGMVTTDDPSVVETLTKARNHGLSSRDQCDFWSFNCRLDELQAALLRVQLRCLDRWTEERRRLAFRYNDLLRPYVDVPDEGPNEYCVYQTYMVQADRRNELQRHLDDGGVEALVHYPTPLHLQPAARSLGYSADDFPMTMRASSRILSLPLFPGQTDAQQVQVAELVRDFYDRHSQTK